MFWVLSWCVWFLQNFTPWLETFSDTVGCGGRDKCQTCIIQDLTFDSISDLNLAVILITSVALSPLVYYLRIVIWVVILGTMVYYLIMTKHLEPWRFQKRPCLTTTGNPKGYACFLFKAMLREPILIVMNKLSFHAAFKWVTMRKVVLFFEFLKRLW